MILDLGMRLKILRIQQKKTQKEVADRLNIDSSTLSSYESGNISPSAHLLAKLASIYHVSSDYILGLDKRMTFCLPEQATEEQINSIVQILERAIELAGLDTLEVQKRDFSSD